MYKGFVVANRETEDVVTLEVNELINATSIKENPTAVVFQFEDLMDLCTITYKAQSIFRTVLLLSEFKVDKELDKTTTNISRKIKELDLGDWLSKNKTFKVNTKRLGEHNFNSVDISSEIGKKIINKTEIEKKYRLKIDYDNPDILFYTYIHKERGYFGIDFAGIELAKRQYKIFNHPESLKGTTGYVVVRKSGFKREDFLLDPFMGSGVLVIEAGLYATKFPVQYYNKDKLYFTKYDFFKKYGSEKFFKEQDSKIKKDETNIYGYDYLLRYLNATKKNARLAGIDKQINLSKIKQEWLDYKFGKKAVDFIVSDPPRMANHKSEKKMAKIYNELFYQAKYILKKEGSICLLTKDYELLENEGKKYGFNMTDNQKIYQGQEKFNLIRFKMKGGK